MVLFQESLPDKYNLISEQEAEFQISNAKEMLGDSSVILGHHYQRDEVIKFADFTGDSFKLCQLAASRKKAQFIVFCGVHFMAESADILSKDYQKVILPDLNAGCSMADMANIDQVEECWDELMDIFDDGSVIPITYMNSAANLKAFCGVNGGAVCTSTNAKSIFEWAFQQGEQVLFFPDEHLGRNTGCKMEIGLDEMIVWNPFEVMGGNTIKDIEKSRVILWKGHCSVHLRFNLKQVEGVRKAFPGIRVIAHPECSKEVVDASDEDGSTEYIIRKVSQGEPGSKWAVGTEIHLVHRLAKQNKDKFVISLNENVCACATMYRIDPPHLLWVLDSLREGRMVNHITVPEDIAEGAKIALDRMLAIA